MFDACISRTAPVMTRKTRMLLLFVPLALLLLFRPAGLRADPNEDFISLGKQIVDQKNAGNYREAERLALQLKQIAEGPLADQPFSQFAASTVLGLLYQDQGRYAEAEPFFEQAVAVCEETSGPEHTDTAAGLDRLAKLYRDQGRYAEAESFFQRSLTIYEKAVGAEHTLTAVSLNELSRLYTDQGGYAEAEPLYKRCLALFEKTVGAEHANTATLLNNVASLYLKQGRYSDAEPLLERSIAILEKTGAVEDPVMAASLDNLAIVYRNRRRYAEAEPLQKRSLAIREALWAAHSQTAETLNHLAVLYRNQGRYTEAEPLCKRSLAIFRNTRGPEHPLAVASLNNLARLYSDQGRYADAEPLCNRAVAIMDKVEAYPDKHCTAYWTRAELAWKSGRRDQAVADLLQAMQIAERIRAESSGGEIQQAQSFAQYGAVFEMMVGWQTELGNPAEGLEGMERSRARGLVDQMATAGMDLLAGLDEKVAAGLRHREQEARARAASLKKQLEMLAGRSDLSADQRRAGREKLQAQLRQAQQDYAAAYAEIRNASPAYRLAVGEDRKPVPLAKLKQWVTDQGALLLEYLLGWKEGYVLIVPADGEPRLERLAVTEQQAKSLGIDAGPLTAKRLEPVLRNGEETGLLQRLARPSNPEEGKQAVAGLAALWEVLVPEAQRKAIRADKYKRLIVVPDGTLANLPFETLVVEAGDNPKYLLDTGLPIQYTPSATILMNLTHREKENATEDRPPVLTIGDCQYSPASDVLEDGVLAQLAPRSRYTGLGGQLKPLPFTEREMRWVAKVFGNSKIPVASLRREMATERIVGHNVSGRRILHFACHGLVDQSHGNLFGALALTPSSDPDNPNDDGFLTLAEIYELNLDGCELAILSACNTNAARSNAAKVYGLCRAVFWSPAPAA